MSSSPISRDLILRLAELSRLGLSEAELDRYARELAQFIDMLSVLDSVDVEGVPPSITLSFDAIALRDDELEQSLERDEALGLAPLSSDGGFAVPKILGGEG